MADPATKFDWASLIPLGIQAGSNIGMGVMNNRSVNKQNAWSQALTESQLKRRNMMQGMAAPSMLKALGYTDPAQIAQMQAQISGDQQPAGATGAQASIPQTPGSGASKVLGGIGAGAGAAGMLGLSSLGGPIGLAAGGLALGASQIGKGRRTANTFVDAVENPFGQKLAQISQMAGTDPKGAAAMLQQEYRNYQSQTQAWQAQGGNQGKVSGQSLTNPKLQQTIQALAQQLGVRL